MAGNDATITISGLNEKLRDFDGSEVVLRDEEGKALPETRQLTLGNVLLGVITRMTPPEEPKRIILARRLGERIAEAMENSGEFVAGSAALGILRDAAKHNGPGYTVPVLAQVWLAIGDGDGGDIESV
jgi:hypothetical protein